MSEVKSLGRPARWSHPPTRFKLSRFRRSDIRCRKYVYLLADQLLHWQLSVYLLDNYTTSPRNNTRRLWASRLSAQDVASDRRFALDHLRHMIFLASNDETFHGPPPTTKPIRLPYQSSKYGNYGKMRGGAGCMKKVSDSWVLAAAGM